MQVTGQKPSLSMINNPLPRYEIHPEKTALVSIDMQFYAGSREEGLGRSVREKRLDEEFAYYFNRIDEIIPNLQCLMEACRDRGIEVVHLISEGYTETARDMPYFWKKQNVLCPKDGNPINPLLAPRPGDIVMPKLACGGFTGGNLDFVLRNLGVKTLIVTGVVLNQCVENTVRVAADLSYDVIVVSDGTATYTPEWQRFGLEVLADQFANVWDTGEVLAELEALPLDSVQERGPLAKQAVNAGG